jgi:hypothetical protein
MSAMRRSPTIREGGNYSTIDVLAYEEEYIDA